MVSTSEQSNVKVVGMPIRPWWTVVLFLLLVASAAFALAAKDSPLFPSTLRVVAPYLFLVFALGFAAYRIALVAAKKYSPFKAFFQIFSAALFFLLLQNPRIEASLTAPVEPLDWAVTHDEAKVRALACEVALTRADHVTLITLLHDSDTSIQFKARAALTALNQGRDLGPESDVWKARFP